jgi:uncharacterized Fe-S radical SAM superfamily protein PflX
MVRMKIELTENEIEDYLMDRLDKSKVAIRSGYHPAGYDMHYPEIKKEKNKYYMLWWRSDTCD